MLIFSQNVPKHFIYEFLPDFIYSVVLEKADKNRFKVMDEYLKSININYSTLGLINYALDNLDVKEVNGTYQIEVSNIIKINEYTLNQLIRLIDYGNTEVKGVNAVSAACDYINKHKEVVINDYLGW